MATRASGHDQESQDEAHLSDWHTADLHHTYLPLEGGEKLFF
jgi:hypothetical protein